MGEMGDVVIRAEGLGKRYRIGRHEAPYKTLRESLSGLAMAPVRQLRAVVIGDAFRRREPETIWALREVDLEVRRGEVLGIVGRNGAGKSTLLKVLSRITEPTIGRVEIRGRVGSLLEVGTGFHPELTGRENIYLNGAILGMRKAEIDRRFDEIVDFAEIERFLDTPVKRYSSGMYVRLAFAVAAHMESEILLVDEVLAVGDSAFQKKCLGKMGAVAREGRTVLLVSHNMTAIRSLCPRSVLIEAGQVAATGSTDKVVRSYLTVGQHAASNAAGDLCRHPGRVSGSKSVLKTITVRDTEGRVTTELLDPSFMIDIGFDVGAEGPSLSGIGFILEAEDGGRVGSYNTYMSQPPIEKLPREGVVRFQVESPILLAGWYTLTVSAGFHQSQVVDKVEVAAKFWMGPIDPYGAGYIPNPSLGVVALSCRTCLLESSSEVGFSPAKLSKGGRF
jgi:lipopolysaccharide transport system ATP-binding protein